MQHLRGMHAKKISLCLVAKSAAAPATQTTPGPDPPARLMLKVIGWAISLDFSDSRTQGAPLHVTARQTACISSAHVCISLLNLLCPFGGDEADCSLMSGGGGVTGSRQPNVRNRTNSAVMNADIVGFFFPPMLHFETLPTVHCFDIH